ncbi:hypothetical protein M3J09_003113 [Ascochyta lentis]
MSAPIHRRRSQSFSTLRAGSASMHGHPPPALAFPG